MDGGNLQQKIQMGYGKAAVKVGASFFLFRSPTPIDPLNPNNLIGIIPVSTNVGWEYMTQQRYGKAVWNMIIETRQTQPLYAQPGDYLVPTQGYFFDLGGLDNYLSSAYGSDDFYLPAPRASAFGTDVDFYSKGYVEDINFYYLASTQFLLPPLGVSCNRGIDIIRPTQVIGAGFQGYAEYLPSTSEIIMQKMPASILEMSTTNQAPTNLPTDTRQPKVIILIPNIGNVIVRADDIIIDDLNQNYVVTDNELTDLGWRILAEQVVNSR